MNADEIIRRFDPELAKALRLDPPDGKWNEPMLGKVHAYGPSGPDDLLHTWREVWMQDRRTRHGWQARVLSDLKWEPSEDVEVHSIEIEHPGVPVFLIVDVSGGYPLLVDRGGALAVTPSDTR